MVCSTNSIFLPKSIAFNCSAQKNKNLPGQKYFVPLQPASLAAQAPAELPQGRKAARVDGCSGAM